MCKDIVNDIVNKMFMQQNFTLKITHGEEHDQPTLNRKLSDDNDDQSIIKRKCNELYVEALEKNVKRRNI